MPLHTFFTNFSSFFYIYATSLIYIMRIILIRFTTTKLTNFWNSISKRLLDRIILLTLNCLSVCTYMFISRDVIVGHFFFNNTIRMVANKTYDCIEIRVSPGLYIKLYDEITNDIPCNKQLVKFAIFADDISLLVRHSRYDIIHR